MTDIESDEIIERWLAHNFRPDRHYGAFLTGSTACGASQKGSDVDVVFLTRADAIVDSDSSYHLSYFGGMLFSFTETTQEEALSFCTDPEKAVKYYVRGLQEAQILRDSNRGALERIQKAAQGFYWSDALAAKADERALYHLAGCAEEAQKLTRYLTPAKNRETSTLYLSLLALAINLPIAIALQQRLLCTGEYNLFEQVYGVMGADSLWSRAHRICLGDVSFLSELELPAVLTSKSRARTGLKLYMETARALAPLVEGEEFNLVHAETRKFNAVIEETMRQLEMLGIWH